MSRPPSRGMALTGSILAIVTATAVLIPLVIVFADKGDRMNSGALVIIASALLLEATGIVLGSIGCAVKAGPILANAIIFTLLTLLGGVVIALTAAHERVPPLLWLGLLLHVLTTVFLWIGFPQASRYRKALASGAFDPPARTPARSAPVAPNGAIDEDGTEEQGDLKTLSVVLQQGMSLLRGDVVLLPGALYFICAKKGGAMGMVFAAVGTQFGAIGGLLGGAISGAIDGAAANAAAKNRQQMVGQLDELVAQHKGSFKGEPNNVEIVGRSFWGTGFIKVGSQKWVFRNGMPKEHVAPFKEWCDANGVRNRNLIVKKK